MEEEGFGLKQEPQEIALSNEANELMVIAENFVITNDEEFATAGESLLRVKKHIKKIDFWFNPLISDANKSHKGLTGRRNEAKEIPLKVESIYKNGMSRYYQEQERIRIAEEARLQREAEKEAEESQLAEAIAAEESGDHDLAETIANEPPAPVPAPVTRATQKPKGVSFSETYKHEVVDMVALVNAVAANVKLHGINSPLLSYLKPDDTVIGQFVCRHKGAFKCPGIRAYPYTRVAGRTK